MPPYYTSSESGSQDDESDSRSSGSSSTDNENQEPYLCWDDDKRAYVSDCGRTILWVDGACPGNHLGPNGGATSGVGVWVHNKKKWKKFNNVYPDTNNVSPSFNHPCFSFYFILFFKFAELYAIEFALEKICHHVRTLKLVLLVR